MNLSIFISLIKRKIRPITRIIKKNYFKVRHEIYMNTKIKIHFYHIGKTGGTNIKMTLVKNFVTYKRKYIYINKYIIILHDHLFGLSDTPVGEKIIFFLREPVKRYVSGFNTRLRQEKPFAFVPWDEKEKKAFSKFITPNELALALHSEDCLLRKDAEDAMRNIGHINTSYFDWFIDFDTFIEREKDILFYGFQEHFDDDFNKLKKILGIPGHIYLNKDDLFSHKTPSYLNNKLDEAATKNIEKWYEEDIKFYNYCYKKYRDKVWKNTK
jgi:hypothetical protein